MVLILLLIHPWLNNRWIFIKINKGTLNTQKKKKNSHWREGFSYIRILNSWSKVTPNDFNGWLSISFIPLVVWHKNRCYKLNKTLSQSLVLKINYSFVGNSKWQKLENYTQNRWGLRQILKNALDT